MEPVPVPVPHCPCPGTPHPDGHTVHLRPKLGLEGGLAVEAAMAAHSNVDTQTLAVTLALVRHNVVAWDFTDAKGSVMPITPESIEELLPYAEGGELVANKAAGLYLDSVYGPLRARLSTRLPKSPLNGQTPPTAGSAKRSQKRRSASSSQRASAGTR
jgi:hypothetical protein